MPDARVDEVDLRLLRALAENERKRSSLPTLVKVSQRIVDRRLQKLKDYKWVKSSRYGHYTLTSLGVRQLEQRQSPDLPLQVNHDAIAQLEVELPSESHQAFFRLLLSGIVAKFQLLDKVDGPWPAFLMMGSTKSFKTALANVVCHVFGLDADSHIYYLQNVTAGEVGVRRVRQKGKKGFVLEPSPLFDEPFICLDEVDKVTDKDVVRNVLFFMHGNRNFTVEQQVLTNRVCPLAIMNPPASGKQIIPDAYLRRSVVLNTDFLKQELPDVDLQARKIFNLMGQQDSGLLQLDMLPRPTSQLGERQFERMRTLFLDQVVPDHQGLVDIRPLELLVLGRKALSTEGTKDGDVLDQALLHTVLDRLVCLETQGGTIPDWRTRVVNQWLEWTGKTDPQIAKAAEQANRKRLKRTKLVQQQEEVIKEQALQKTKDELALTHVKGMAEQKLAQMHLKVKELAGREWKLRTKTIRDKLKQLIGKIRKAKSPEEVKAFKEIGMPLIAEGQRLIERYAQEQEAKAQQEAQEQRLKEQRRVIKRQIIEVERYLTRKTLKPGESIAQILVQLECLGTEVCEYQGHSLPEKLAQYSPKLVQAGTFEKHKDQAGAILFESLIYEAEKWNSPDNIEKIEAKYQSHWEYVVCHGIDGAKYAILDFDSWPKAGPLLQIRLDQLQEKLGRL